jgi:6-pyruvoyltetrahydropterin/6-carboxytetrahydropterin synthase
MSAAPPSKAEIIQGFRFEAAHFLPAVGPQHRCRRVHGHSYKVDVHVVGEVDPATGWVVDFYDIEAVFAPLLNTLDHHLLNEVPGLENPTAENIALWIWGRLSPALPGLSAVVVHETEHSRAVVRG